MNQENTKSFLETILTKLKPDHIIVLVLVLAMGIWVFATIGILNKNYDLEKQVRQGQLENELQEIENENLKLQQAYYRTDEYLELSAREKLNKALPGEHLVVLPKTTSSEKIQTGTVNYVDERSNLEKWLDFLFGKH